MTKIKVDFFLVFSIFLFFLSFAETQSMDIPANVALDILRGRVGAYNVAEINNLTATAVPGISYSNLSKIPDDFSFSCSQVHQAGYYADVELNCQVYHRCEENMPLFNYLCPEGKLFNQIILNCDWWYNVQCERSKQFYDYSNPRIYLGPNVTFLNNAPMNSTIRPNATPEVVISHFPQNPPQFQTNDNNPSGRSGDSFESSSKISNKNKQIFRFSNNDASKVNANNAGNGGKNDKIDLETDIPSRSLNPPVPSSSFDPVSSPFFDPANVFPRENSFQPVEAPRPIEHRKSLANLFNSNLKKLHRLPSSAGPQQVTGSRSNVAGFPEIGQQISGFRSQPQKYQNQEENRNFFKRPEIDSRREIASSINFQQPVTFPSLRQSVLPTQSTEIAITSPAVLNPDVAFRGQVSRSKLVDYDDSGITTDTTTAITIIEATPNKAFNTQNDRSGFGTTDGLSQSLFEDPPNAVQGFSQINRVEPMPPMTSTFIPENSFQQLQGFHQLPNLALSVPSQMAASYSVPSTTEPPLQQPSNEAFWLTGPQTDATQLNQWKSDFQLNTNQNSDSYQNSESSTQSNQWKSNFQLDSQQNSESSTQSFPTSTMSEPLRMEWTPPSEIPIWSMNAGISGELEPITTAQGPSETFGGFFKLFSGQILKPANSGKVLGNTGNSDSAVWQSSDVVVQQPETDTDKSATMFDDQRQQESDQLFQKLQFAHSNSSEEALAADGFWQNDGTWSK